MFDHHDNRYGNRYCEAIQPRIGNEYDNSSPCTSSIFSSDSAGTSLKFRITRLSSSARVQKAVSIGPMLPLPSAPDGSLVTWKDIRQSNSHSDVIQQPKQQLTHKAMNDDHSYYLKHWEEERAVKSQYWDTDNEVEAVDSSERRDNACDISSLPYCDGSHNTGGMDTIDKWGCTATAVKRFFQGFLAILIFTHFAASLWCSGILLMSFGILSTGAENIQRLAINKHLISCSSCNAKVPDYGCIYYRLCVLIGSNISFVASALLFGVLTGFELQLDVPDVIDPVLTNTSTANLPIQPAHTDVAILICSSVFLGLYSVYFIVPVVATGLTIFRSHAAIKSKTENSEISMNLGHYLLPTRQEILNVLDTTHFFFGIASLLVQDTATGILNILSTLVQPVYYDSLYNNHSVDTTEDRHGVFSDTSRRRAALLCIRCASLLACILVCVSMRLAHRQSIDIRPYAIPLRVIIIFICIAHILLLSLEIITILAPNTGQRFIDYIRAHRCVKYLGKRSNVGQSTQRIVSGFVTSQLSSGIHLNVDLTPPQCQKLGHITNCDRNPSSDTLTTSRPDVREELSQASWSCVVNGRAPQYDGCPLQLNSQPNVVIEDAVDPWEIVEMKHISAARRLNEESNMAEGDDGVRIHSLESVNKQENMHSILDWCADTPADGILMSRPYVPEMLQLTPNKNMTTSLNELHRIRASTMPSPFASNCSPAKIPSLIRTLHRETICPTPVPPGCGFNKLPAFPMCNRSPNTSLPEGRQQLTPFLYYMQQMREQEMVELDHRNRGI